MTSNPPNVTAAASSRAAAIAQVTAVGMPYELEQVSVFDRPCLAFKNAPPTLRALYDEARSDATFFVYEDERYTFEDVWQLAARMGRILVDQYGVAKGDRVAISMRNFPEWVISFNAVTSIGAVAVAMNALWQTDELEFGLTDCAAKVLIADQERLDRLAQCEDPPAVQVIAVRTSDAVPTGAVAWSELLAAQPACPMPDADIEPNDDATILYTSGSTGHPKGAVSCHRNIVSALLSWELDGQVALAMNPELAQAPDPAAPPPATLLAVPLFHVTGLHAVLLGSYRAQRSVVSMYKWDVGQAMELIERERISSFVGPAAMTGDLVLGSKTSDRDLSSLQTVGGGGAPRAPEQVKNIDESFANAMPNTGWGMTETNAIGTGIGGADYLARPGSSGRVSAILEVRVLDEQGRRLGPGERGELQIRGTSVIRGYWNRPDANAETFDGDWLRTGDVAYIDEDGFLFIVDRIKDMVIRGGENIGCGEVEAALLEHADVLEAAVYGVPDERLGEEVGAVVYHTNAIDEEQLTSFLKERLAAFKVPKYLRFMSVPLPRTASGKILKRQLRDEAAAEL